MKVIFKRNWFGPDGRRYRMPRDRFDTPREVAEEYRNQLPSDCTIVEGEEDQLPSDAAGILSEDEARDDAKSGEEDPSAAFKKALREEGEHPGRATDSGAAAHAAHTAAADAASRKRATSDRAKAPGRAKAKN